MKEQITLSVLLPNTRHESTLDVELIHIDRRGNDYWGAVEPVDRTARMNLVDESVPVCTLDAVRGRFGAQEDDTFVFHTDRQLVAGTVIEIWLEGKDVPERGTELASILHPVIDKLVSDNGCGVDIVAVVDGVGIE